MRLAPKTSPPAIRFSARRLAARVRIGVLPGRSETHSLLAAEHDIGGLPDADSFVDLDLPVVAIVACAQSRSRSASFLSSEATSA